MNLLKQVESLKQAALQASSLQRHAHHAASQLTWVNIGSNEPTAITRKAGSSKTSCPILGHQHPVQQAFELACTVGELAVACAIGIAAAEQFVGNIQRREHG
jgi:hypothetical protein